VLLHLFCRCDNWPVTNSTFVFRDDGDLHDHHYCQYARTISLSGTALSGASSREYYLTVYPTHEFFAIYTTNSATIATVGAVLIVMVTSLIFFLYDFLVRREFNANHRVLDAKRKFMRFVSHEGACVAKL